jgi:hypothetical protein
MIMIRSFALALASLAILAATRTAVFLVSAVDRFIGAVMSIASPAEPLALAGFGTTLPKAGRSLSPSLLNSLRHEAHVSRQSADRHI